MRYVVFIILFTYSHYVYPQGSLLENKSIKVSYNSGSKGGNEKLLARHYSLKTYCPIPKAQGGINSCTGWAMAYGAMSVAYAISQGWENRRDMITRYAFSPLYLFLNNIKESDCANARGALLEETAIELIKKGTLRFSDFDDNISSCTDAILDSFNRKTHHRISGYNYIFEDKTSDGVKIENTKLSLLENKPVIISMSLLENFTNIRSGEDTWYPSIGNTTITNNHAVLVVGYDNERKAFEIMNSYGEGWANNGFIWIKYEDFKTYAKRGLQMVTEFIPLNPSNQSFIISFDQVTSKSKPIKTSPLKVKRTNNFEFEIVDEIISNAKYQITLSGNYEGLYLYLLNIESSGQRNIFYPRDEDINELFFGESSDAFLSNYQSKKRFPTDSTCFGFDPANEEYFVLFYSLYPISNFTENLSFNSLSRNRNILNDQLEENLADRIVPKENINFIDGVIQVKFPSDKRILPVIFKVPLRVR